MASEEPLFDPSLVKKKKKKVIDLDDFDAQIKKSSKPEPAPAAEAPAAAVAAVPEPAAAAAEPKADPAGAEGDAPAGEDGDLFGGLKKKSKKKKALPLDLDEAADNLAPAADATAAATEGDADFGELKKKTKKSKKKTFDLDAFEKELDGAEGDGDGEGGAVRLNDDKDLGDDPFANEDGAAEGAHADDDAPEAWLGTDRDYTYQELLVRIFKTLRSQNPALSGDRKKYSIVPPNVQRDGSKKTMFANLYDICKRMHRQPEHVIQYLFSELGTIGSLDGSQRLIIKGRFTQKQIEHVLRTYIVEYVTCKTCKSPNTLLTKENRIYFMTCESCGSQRSVSAIRTGFVAQTSRRIRT